jgi:hypothetical protein
LTAAIRRILLSDKEQILAQAPSYGARGLQRIIALPEAATQSFVIGDFLILDPTYGRVGQAAAPGSRVVATSGAQTGRIVGRAMQNASGKTGKLVDVMIAEPHTEFLLPCYYTGGGSAVPDTNLIGKQFELLHVDAAVDYYAVDLEHNTAVKCKVTDMYIPDHTGWDPTLPGFPTEVSATQYGQVWVEFMSAHTIYGGGV